MIADISACMIANEWGMDPRATKHSRALLLSDLPETVLVLICEILLKGDQGSIRNVFELGLVRQLCPALNLGPPW